MHISPLSPNFPTQIIDISEMIQQLFMGLDISLALCCLHSVWTVCILVTYDRGGLLALNATLTFVRIYELLKLLSVIVCVRETVPAFPV